MRSFECVAAAAVLTVLGCSGGDGSTAMDLRYDGGADGASGSSADDVEPREDDPDSEDVPRRIDTDGGGVPDAPDVDGDGPPDDSNVDADGLPSGSDVGADDNADVPRGVGCQVTESRETDSDGDGLDDEVETRGWTVTIQNGFGELTERHVRSNPHNPDSNGDGLCDHEARQSFLDPNAEQGDTDGDGLSDIDERDRWASSPIDVDSDDDSSGDPRLFDGNEVQTQGTSPTLADSDGDGISDYKEIVELGNAFHPLIANTPNVAMKIAGAPNIQLQIVDTATNEIARNLEATLEQGSETNYSKTDTDAHQVSAEASFALKQQVGWDGLTPATKVAWEASFTAGYSYTNTRSVTRGAVESSKEAYSEALNESRSQGREVSGGTIEIAVDLENVGDITFTLGDYEVSAILVDPNDPGSFRPLTALSFSTQIGESGIGLGPGASAGPLVAAGELTTEEAMQLLANPQNLRFEVANVALSYQNPDNGSNRGLLDFEYLRQETNAKTAFVQIDFGNGTVLRHRVATNVDRQEGRIVGVGLDRVLDILGLDYELATETLGDVSVQKIGRIEDPVQGQVISNERDRNYVWMVAGNTTVDFDSSTDLKDIVLRGGDSIYVMYVRDEDEDYLFAHEEYLYGTLDTNPDFDGDGIDDGDEVKLGWHTFRVGEDLFPPVSPYEDDTHVNSDPTRTDADNDGLTDSEEREAGTDPNNPDTDGDGYCDGPGAGTIFVACASDVDPDPLDPTKTGNVAPTLHDARLETEGLLVTAIVDARDVNDNLVEVVLAWGDGSSSTVSATNAGFNGFGAIRESHGYDLPGDYEVTVTARDAFGETATNTLLTSAATPRNGLLLEYLFDNGGLADTSGNGNDASAEGFYPETDGCILTGADRFGLANFALHLNDVNRSNGECALEDSFLRAPHLPLVDEMSMAMWVRAMSNAGFVMGQDDPNHPFDGRWAYFHYGRDENAGYGETSRVNFVLKNADQSDAIVVSDPEEVGDAWVFYAVTVTVSGEDYTVTLHRAHLGDSEVSVVAAQTKTGDYANPSTVDPFYVGNGPIGGINLRGLMDDVRVFDRGLAAGELSALLKEGL